MKNPALIVLALFLAALISVFMSLYTVQTDFWNLYYRQDFVYSAFADYCFGLLRVMPYHVAKAVFLFVNFAVYVVSVGLILKANGMRERWFYYPLALSLLWLPFVAGMRLANCDAVLLFIMTMAVFSADRGRVWLSGCLLGVAALFKVYPVAFAGVMGMKDWRIAVSCVVTLGVSFFLPDSFKWFGAIEGFMANERFFSLPYLLFGGYFWGYALVVACMTAWVSWRMRERVDYFALASFALPSAFLAVSVIEYQHLTALVFVYAYALGMRKDTRLMAGSVMSFVIISLGYTEVMDVQAAMFLGLLPLWFALGKSFCFSYDKQIMLDKNAEMVYTF